MRSATAFCVVRQGDRESDDAAFFSRGKFLLNLAHYSEGEPTRWPWPLSTWGERCSTSRGPPPLNTISAAGAPANDITQQRSTDGPQGHHCAGIFIVATTCHFEGQ